MKICHLLLVELFLTNETCTEITHHILIFVQIQNRTDKRANEIQEV